MTSKDFIIWLKGFTEGVHQYNITPVQWETLKEQLAKVDDNIIPMGGVIVDHNTFKVNDQGFYQNPNGTGGPVFTTTPGTSGHITITNPNSFTISTATSLPSGSAISYTNSTDKTLLHD